MLAQSRGVLAVNRPGTNEIEAPEEVYGGGAAGTSEGEVDAGSRGFVLHAGNSSMGRNNGQEHTMDQTRRSYGSDPNQQLPGQPSQRNMINLQGPMTGPSPFAGAKNDAGNGTEDGSGHGFGKTAAVGQAAGGIRIRQRDSVGSQAAGSGRPHNIAISNQGSSLANQLEATLLAEHNLHSSYAEQARRFTPATNEPHARGRISGK